MFNKQDNKKCQSFFTGSDLEQIQSIGQYISELFQSFSVYKRIVKKNQKTQQVLKDQYELLKKANKLKKRNKLLEKLLICLEKQEYLEENMAKLLKEVMDSSGVYIYYCNDNKAKLSLFSGEKEVGEQILDLVENTCFVTKTATNIKSLQKSPLFSGEKSLDSCLIIPLKIASGQEFVISFMRKSKQFSFIDQSYSDKIKEKLEKYEKMIPDSIEFQEYSNKNLENILKFTIPLNSSLFDFYDFFCLVKEKLIYLMNLNSCSIYVADQISNQLWTRNSNSSNSLFFPFSRQNLIGTCYFNGKPVVYPGGDIQNSEDMIAFKDKEVLAIPILNVKFDNPVLGVIVMVRMSDSFNEKDLELATFYAKIVASVLEDVYILNLEKIETDLLIPNRAEKSLSQESLFQKVNLKTTKASTYDNKKQDNLPLSVKNILEFSIGSSSVLENCKNVLKLVIENNDLRLFNKNIPQISGCAKSAILLIQDSNFTLQDLETNEIFTPNDSILDSLTGKQVLFFDFKNGIKDILIKNSEKEPLGKVQNLLVVPILNYASVVIGVIYMGNFKANPGPGELRDFGLIGTLAGYLYSNSEAKLWQCVNEYKNSDFNLQKWLRSIYRVKKICLFNLIRCKNTATSLEPTHSFEDICQALLQIISYIANSSAATLKLYNSEFAIKISGSAFIQSLSVNTKMKIQSNLHKPTTKTIEDNKYILRVPIKYKSVVGLLKITNSEQSLVNEFINDTHSFISEIKEIFIEIIESLIIYPNITMINKEKIVGSTKILALNYRPISLYICIQKAVSDLLDCEFAILALKSNEKLYIPDQKSEFNLQNNYILEESSGIINSVLESGKIEVIQNAYDDERFNSKLDILTGYRTANLICAPLIYNTHKIGGILGVNKINGKFSQNDISTMNNLLENVCMSLDLIQNVQNTLEERSRLMAISKLMDKHVIIFNRHGLMVHSNKPTQIIFKASFEELKNIEYNKYIPYPELKEDLSSVLDHQKKSAQRFSQKFKNYEENNEVKLVNYSVTEIHFFSLDCINGVMLIIEDCRVLDNLYKDFKDMQQSVREITSPISVKTKLKSTIEELRLISFSLENQELRSRIDDVISGLRDKNLMVEELEIDDQDATIGNLASMLELPNQLTKMLSSSTMDNLDDILENDFYVTLDELRNWDLNPFHIDNHFDYIISMLNDYNLLSIFQIDYTNLMNFLTKIKQAYSTWKNPFHNFMHGFNVMHGIYMLLSSTQAGTYFSSHQILALLLASLCHDVDHRGRTNTFEVNKRTSIANTHHDESVLEKHHAAITFHIINEESSNILANISREKYIVIRKLMILSILSTDMTKHLRIIDECKNRFLKLESQEMGTMDNDIEILSEILMHGSDLFHPCKPFKIYEIWSILVSQEFTDQYNEELELEIPVTSFFKDLDKPFVYYSNEIGFLGYIVKPLWDCLQIFLSPDVDKLVENLGENIEIMKKKKEYWMSVEKEKE